jgi:hypothetical protein
VHGTSAHLKFADNKITFFSGGETYQKFVDLFHYEELKAKFIEQNLQHVTIYGEAYGGKQQGQSYRYGTSLKFVAFDVLVGEYSWLSVPDADSIVCALGLEFVHYVKIPATLEAIDAERDAPSVQAVRNGITTHQPREGIVLRPLIPLRKNNGDRIVAKHKGPDDRETQRARKVNESLEVLAEADQIAKEFVVKNRLNHVLDKFKAEHQRDACIQDTRVVIDRMINDIKAECSGEFVPSKLALREISNHTAVMFKQHLKDQLKELAA